MSRSATLSTSFFSDPPCQFYMGHIVRGLGRSALIASYYSEHQRQVCDTNPGNIYLVGSSKVRADRSESLNVNSSSTMSVSSGTRFSTHGETYEDVA